MPERDMGEAADESVGRPFWSGTVSFGLVNVPVGLYPASRSNAVALRMVSEKGTPLRRKYFTSKEDEPLDWQEIVRGYEVDKKEFVPLSEDELQRVAPEKTGNIDLRLFVKATEIDPVYFERGYYMVPDGTNTKAYRLLAAVMEETGLAGVATFVMRAREYVAAIFAEKGILRAETMRFADELRTPKSIGLPKPARTAAAEVRKIERAIEKLTEEKFDEKDLVDHSAVRLLDLVEKKLDKGEDVVELSAEESEQREDADVIDLMAALEKSLRKSTGRAPRSRKARPRSRRAAARR